MRTIVTLICLYRIQMIHIHRLIMSIQAIVRHLFTCLDDESVPLWTRLSFVFFIAIVICLSSITWGKWNDLFVYLQWSWNNRVGFFSDHFLDWSNWWTNLFSFHVPRFCCLSNFTQSICETYVCTWIYSHWKEIREWKWLSSLFNSLMLSRLIIHRCSSSILERAQKLCTYCSIVFDSSSAKM